MPKTPYTAMDIHVPVPTVLTLCVSALPHPLSFSFLFLNFYFCWLVYLVNNSTCFIFTCVFPMRGTFAPQGTCGDVWYLGCHVWGKDTAGISWADARDCHTSCRTAPTRRTRLKASIVSKSYNIRTFPRQLPGSSCPDSPCRKQGGTLKWLCN